MNTKTSKSRALVYGVLTILAVGMVIPFVWMLLASFKTSNEVFSIPMKLMPEIWHGENYQEIWKKIPLLTFFVNTTKLTLITTVIQVLTSCFAAYGLSLIFSSIGFICGSTSLSFNSNKEV